MIPYIHLKLHILCIALLFFVLVACSSGAMPSNIPPTAQSPTVTASLPAPSTKTQAPPPPSLAPSLTPLSQKEAKAATSTARNARLVTGTARAYQTLIPTLTAWAAQSDILAATYDPNSTESAASVQATLQAKNASITALMREMGYTGDITLLHSPTGPGQYIYMRDYVKNFILDFDLPVPCSQCATDRQTWGLKLQFRVNKFSKMGYTILVDGVGYFEEYRYLFGVKEKYDTIPYTPLGDLKYNRNEINNFRLVALDDVGYFFVNGILKRTLDLSNHMDPGTIRLGDYSMRIYTLMFTNFTVWQLDK
jgi:hypothetical protein